MSKDDPHAFEKASTPLEDLKGQYAGAQPQQGLPVHMRDSAGKTHLSSILQPSQADVQLFADPRTNVCGNCKYFDLESGRREMIRQRFGEKLIHEYEWKLRHLGAEIDAIALCGASGGDTAVTFVSKACDQFRVKS